MKIASIHAESGSVRDRRMAVFENMKSALLLVSSLFFVLEAHGQSLTASPAVNAGDKPTLQYPKPPQPIPQNRPQPRAVPRDPHCPGKGNAALMCSLVNQYRAKYGLGPVQ